MYKWFYLGGVIVFLISLFIVVSNNVSYGRTDSWLERAKDAGNPQQVAEFLTEYKTSLLDRDLVVGHYYIFWKYPATKMEIYLRVIDGLIDRANDLALQNPTDTSFQMGLTNLEKDLGDIEATAFSVWKAEGGIFIILILVITVFYTLLGWIPLAAY